MVALDEICVNFQVIYLLYVALKLRGMKLVLCAVLLDDGSCAQSVLPML